MHELRLDKFKLIAGDLSLEFVNTLSGYIRIPDDEGVFKYSIYGDKIEDYIDLISWSNKVGFLNERQAGKLLSAAEKDRKTSGAVVRRAIRLRGALYRLFKAKIGNWQPDEKDLLILNTELLIARKNEKLDYFEKKFGWSWPDRETSLDCMLWMVSLSAADLLASDLLAKVRECAGERCGWLFIDKSRSGTRSWCDMKDCGNLAKVRRFRSRQHA